MHTQLITGESAASRFKEHLSWLFRDDVEGTLYMADGTPGLLKLTRCTMCLADSVMLDLVDNASFDGVAFFLLECKSLSGETWKSTFYPHAKVNLFIKEPTHVTVS